MPFFAGDNIEVKRPKKSHPRFAEYLEVIIERNTRESKLKKEQLTLEREKVWVNREREQRMKHEAAILQLIKILLDKQAGWSSST